MEWLKLAFDTLVVGALAMPWLWLFVRIFFQRGTGTKDDIEFPLIDALSEETRQTIAGVRIIAVGFFLVPPFPAFPATFSMIKTSSTYYRTNPPFSGKFTDTSIVATTAFLQRSHYQPSRRANMPLSAENRS